MSLPFSPPANSAVLVGGGRSVAPGSPAWVACQNFVQELLYSPSCHFIHVGCATGADQAAILAFGGGSVQCRVFAAFAQSGAGSFPGSAVATVQNFHEFGEPVHWLAGGGLSVPLVARLMSSSIAALRGCSAAVFFSPGIGSLKVARAALRQGIPVLVSQVSMSSAPVLAVAPVAVSWLGQSFWLFAPPHQPGLL